MITSSRLAVLIAASLLMSGCVHYAWVKPGGDPGTFPADNYACKQNAINTAPPVFETYAPYPYNPHPTRVVTNCHDHGPREVCRTRIVGDMSMYQPAPPANDLNAYNRDELYNACMGAKGWVLQAVEK